MVAMAHGHLEGACRFTMSFLHFVNLSFGIEQEGLGSKKVSLIK